MIRRATTTTGSLPLSKSLWRMLLKKAFASRRRVASFLVGTRPPSGHLAEILQEVQSLLQKYRSELVRQSCLLGPGYPARFVLINPAQNPSISRRRFPTRSCYRSPRLIRENPLPRSQFVVPRRFPRGSTAPTKLLAPPIIRHLAHPDLADCVHHVLALRDQN